MFTSFNLFKTFNTNPGSNNGEVYIKFGASNIEINIDIIVKSC